MHEGPISTVGREYQVQLGDARLAVPSGELISARSLRGASDANARPKVIYLLPYHRSSGIIFWDGALFDPATSVTRTGHCGSGLGISNLLFPPSTWLLTLPPFTWP